MGIALGTNIRFFENGEPVVAGSVYFYEPGTTTPKTIYTDSTLGTPAANPLTTNANGEVVAWGTGKYKIRCENASAALVDEEDNVDLSPESPTTLALDDGSAASPSASFTSDTDTGVYRRGANNLGLAAGGGDVVSVRTAGLYAENDTDVGALEADGTTTRSIGRVNVSDEVVLSDAVDTTLIRGNADATGPEVSLSDGVGGRYRVASFQLKNAWTKGEYTKQDTVTAQASTTVDADESNAFFINLTASISTLTIDNLDDGQTIRILIKQDAGGSNTVDFSSIRWAGGSAPTMTATASRYDLYVITGMDNAGATTPFGVAHQNMT